MAVFDCITLIERFVMDVFRRNLIKKTFFQNFFFGWICSKNAGSVKKVSLFIFVDINTLGNVVKVRWRGASIGSAGFLFRA